MAKPSSELFVWLLQWSNNFCLKSVALFLERLLAEGIQLSFPNFCSGTSPAQKLFWFHSAGPFCTFKFAKRDHRGPGRKMCSMPVSGLAFHGDFLHTVITCTVSPNMSLSIAFTFSNSEDYTTTDCCVCRCMPIKLFPQEQDKVTAMARKVEGLSTAAQRKETSELLSGTWETRSSRCHIVGSEVEAVTGTCLLAWVSVVSQQKQRSVWPM